MSDAFQTIPIPRSVMARPAGFWDAKLGIDADEVLVRYCDRLEAFIRDAQQHQGITDRPIDLAAGETYYHHCDPTVTGLNRDEAGFYIRQLALASKGGF